MAKSKEQAPSAPSEETPAAEAASVEAPPPPAPEPAPPWRTVAFARAACSIAYPWGVVAYLGGDLEDEPSRVEVLRSVGGWDLVDIESPEHLEQLCAERAQELESLAQRAAALGYRLLRSGQKA